jgi:hypothetical protein
MDITDRLKEIILKETNIDINIDRRDRELVEMRALYYTILKDINKKYTLQEIGDSVNKNHATVIYGLKEFKNFRRFNNDLDDLYKKIYKYFDLQYEDGYKDNDKLVLDISDLMIQNNVLKEEIETIKAKQLKFDYKIIEKLNNLLDKTKDTEHHNVMIIRLEAIYDMNMKVIEHNKNN